MRAPRPVLAVATVAVVFLTLPVIGLAQRTPWSSLGASGIGLDSQQPVRISSIVEHARERKCHLSAVGG